VTAQFGMTRPVGSTLFPVPFNAALPRQASPNLADAVRENYSRLRHVQYRAECHKAACYS